MPAQGWRSSVLVVYALILTVGGCGGPASDSTTSTATPVTAATTSVVPGATATTDAEGPQPLRGAVLEPGEYVTTVFEPMVRYRIERVYPLSAFQSQHNTGLQNRTNTFLNVALGIAGYKGVVVHDWWLGLTPDEILAEVERVPSLELESPIQVEFNGFPTTVIEATAPSHVVLWQNRANPRLGGVDGAWNAAIGQRIRLMIVSTPAGSLLITVQANDDEWAEFLPVAEEILAGISFPDLAGG